MTNHLTAIVLAAGRGTRMNASVDQNKVAMTLNQKPMIRYTIDTLKQSGIDKIITVVGFAKESVIAALGSEVTYAEQDQPQGTGHAVKVALPQVPPDSTQVIVMSGDDSAFYTQDLLTNLITTHQLHGNAVTLVSLHADDPTGLGRIIRDHQGQLKGIVEEKNADASQKLITEINTGCYCFDPDFLKWAVDQIERNPVSQEYYITDAVALACNRGEKVEALLWDNQDIWHGVNTPEQLRLAEERMRQKNAVQ